MKSLERRFKDIEDKNPNYSSYICFAKAVEEQNFNRSTINRWFTELVEKDDYASDEKKEIVDHLVRLTKTR